MRFLIDASLPRGAEQLLKNHGHEGIDVRDIGMPARKDTEIADYVKQNQIALISADFDFADIRIYPPAEYFGLIVIDRPEDATIREVLKLLENFLMQPDLLANLVGRLFIVDASRARIRPALP